MFKCRRVEFWIILGAAVATVIGRSLSLGELSLWFDEGFSAWAAGMPVKESLALSFSGEPNPPLYPIFLHFCAILFGESETTLRFPSVIFGGANVVLMGWIAWRFVSPRVGALAALWTSASPLAITYSREARVYSAFCFFSLLAMGTLPELGKNWNRGIRIVHGMALALALWLHAYAFFLIPAQAIYIVGLYLTMRKQNQLVEAKRFGRQWLTSLLIVSLLSCWWYLAVLTSLASYHSHFAWIENFHPPLSMFVDGYFEITPWMSGFTVLGICALIFLWKSRQGFGLVIVQQPAWSLTLFTIVTLVVPYLVGLCWHRSFLPRYAIGGGIASYIWLLAPLASTLDRRRFLFWCLCFLFGLSAILATESQITNLRKEEWRPAIASLSREPIGTLLLVTPAYYAETSPNYYIRRLALVGRIVTAFPRDRDAFVQAIKGRNRLWLVTVNTGGDVEIKSAWLGEQGFRPERRAEFYKITLEEFVRD